ncbi:hypothetical protein [Geothrix alkalitolerans]|uniref:hypothetical protein n=1 Tax=Geothrix alkalitolerans TaxID=2922724 RepID=UPI001FB03002|nr:hypothetical protein [Geothrix alkalitolerans]
MKEGAVAGAPGAIVLEDKYGIERSKLIRTYRVRILADRGREAASLPLFMGDAPKIKGRTCYPDGKSIGFDSLKDFQVKSKIETTRWEAKRTVVIPPGINGDCVFEARWEEPELGFLTSRFIQYLGGKFPVRRAVIEIAKDVRRSYLVMPGKGVRSNVIDAPKLRQFVLLDLPPEQNDPFGLKTALDLPRIVVFDRQVARSLMKGAAQEQDPRVRANLFWSEHATEDLRPVFERRWHTGDVYNTLREALFKDLPATPHARASALLMRLNGRIRNLDQSTFAEVAADKGIHNYSDWLDYWNIRKPWNLNVIAELGVTTRFGMRSMYYYLLREAGIRPFLCLVADRNLLLFDYNILDTNQYSHYLIGVEEPGKGILWLDPTLRFASPGLIPPEYQGTSAVLIDTGTWKASPYTLPVQSALANQRLFQYQVSLDEEGESFSATAEFSGLPDYLARNRLRALDGPGQNRLLKEDLEHATKYLALTKTEVLHAQDPYHNLSWRVEGRCESDSTGEREVHPFPVLPEPLEIPDAFPGSRSEPILLPYRSTLLAVSRFRMPPGYRCAPLSPLTRQNRFGSVNWLAALETQDGVSSVRVVLRVDVTGFFEKADAYDELRAFCGWIRESLGKTIRLEQAR